MIRLSVVVLDQAEQSVLRKALLCHRALWNTPASEDKHYNDMMPLLQYPLIPLQIDILQDGLVTLKRQLEKERDTYVLASQQAPEESDGLIARPKANYRYVAETREEQCAFCDDAIQVIDQAKSLIQEKGRT